MCVARYNRWMKYVRLAPWNSYETVGFETPKGHAVLHFLPFVFLFGAVDNARLDNFEHDHQIWVKKLVKRTQMRYDSMMRQLEDAADHVDAVRGMRSLERSHCIGIYTTILWYLYQFFMFVNFAISLTLSLDQCWAKREGYPTAISCATSYWASLCPSHQKSPQSQT